MIWKKLFGTKSATPQEVKTGRFELGEGKNVAYLDYTIAGNILGLIHSEVPKELRGKGLSSELAKTALQWARDNNMKVDVVCPSVTDYIKRHPEYSDLLLH